MSDDLSRLLDGELPPAEADALRARIEADPALAARWARMQRLPRDLAGLPAEVPVPAPRAPRLDPPTTRSSWPWGLAAAGWAAALWFALLPTRPGPVRVLTAGSEWVRGRADVAAGDLRVEIDGTAKVTMEPPPHPRREVVAEDIMNPSHLVSALAGSIVTITVIEGSAWLHAADAPPTEIVAGETRGFTSTGAPVDARARPAGHDQPGSAPGEQVAALRGEVARLEKEKMQLAAKLRGHEGEAQPWPKDVAAAYTPDAFEAFVNARLAGVKDAGIALMDCEEYPCVVVVESTSTDPEWAKKLSVIHDDMQSAGFGEDPSVTVLASETAGQPGEPDVRLYAVAVGPGEVDQAAVDRMKYRAESALKDLSGE